MSEKSRDGLIGAIEITAKEKKNPAGNDYRYLSVQAVEKLAENFKLTSREIQIAALENQIIPDRYERSIGTVGIEGQIKLLNSTVGVIGAGGLGGFSLELLARMGVGRLVIVDGDTFSDSNLNRQMLATELDLGKPKVEAARERVGVVNSATEIIAHPCRGDATNLPEIFSECDLVIDCLDNLSSRYVLEDVCSKLNIIMIHGAIAGYLGQLAVIRPDKPLLAAIYGSKNVDREDKGVEIQLGNPAATPAMLASWQVSEAVKILAGLDGVMASGKMLIIDMQSGDSYMVEVG